MSYNISKSHSKIIAVIKNSKNELHLRTCCAMIAQFNLMESNLEILKESLELDLKNKLDEQAVKLGLLTI